MNLDIDLNSSELDMPHLRRIPDIDDASILSGPIFFNKDLATVYTFSSVAKIFSVSGQASYFGMSLNRAERPSGFFNLK